MQKRGYRLSLSVVTSVVYFGKTKTNKKQTKQFEKTEI